MDVYIPADNRAAITRDKLLEPYMRGIIASTSIKEVVAAMITHLPPVLAHETELRTRMHMVREHNFSEQKLRAMEIAEELLEMMVSHNLKAYSDRDGNRRYYYMREDIIRWFNSNPDYARYLPQPPQEIITIELKYNGKSKTSAMALNEDQMVGIVFALSGMKNDRVTLRSSITNQVVAVKDIAQHAISYLMGELATDRLKRPYRVGIKDPQGEFIDVHFLGPEFMQGVISVAQWYGLPDNGNNSLWRNLEQFTRDGIIPLSL